jgi:hypothetical protein
METATYTPEIKAARAEKKLPKNLRKVMIVCAAALLFLAACKSQASTTIFESGVEYTIQSTLILAKNLGDSEHTCEVPAGSKINIAYEYPNRNGIEDNKFQIEADSTECDEGWANYWDLLNASLSKSIASSSTN